MKKSIQVLVAFLMAAAIAVPAKGLGTTLRAETDQEPGSEEVEINKENFPDEVFRSIVQSEFDKDHNKKLSEDEVLNAVQLDVTDRGIKTLKGVEYLSHLVYLDCSMNSLTELDLSQNTELFTALCHMNELTKLDLSNCKALQNLSCDQNYLKNLDLSDLVSLESLTCSVNDLGELDISKNKKLIDLHCDTTDLIHAGEGMVMEPDEEREINNHISKLNLKNNPEMISFSCAGNKISELDFSSCPAIAYIIVDNNVLTKLKVANSSNLIYLMCESNKLKTLDLTGCSSLSGLTCNDNQITALDLRDCEEINFIDCAFNKIKTIDVGNAENCMSICAENNQLESLDLSKMHNMNQLLLASNKLKSIDVSRCRDLMTLDCGDNPFTELDVSKNVNLTTLAVFEGNLEKLTLPKHGNLEQIFLTSNKLKTLDVSGFANLAYLIAEDNALTEIDLTRNPQLKFVFLGDNQISNVDLSKNTGLVSVGFRSNKLTSLDLSKCSDLEDVELDGNNLSELKLPKKDSKLQFIFARENQLAELDVSGYPNLKELYLSENKLSKLDVSKNTQLECLTLHGNKITAMDISKCTELVNRLEKFGVSESVDGSYFFSVYKEEKEGEGYCYFSVDTKVDLNGYKLPEPSVPVKPDDPTFEDFVERLYTVALGRASEPEGKAFWVKQVVEEGKTGADCARFFLLEADEFMKRNLSVDDFVETLYATFFDRASDAAGKKGWVDAISSGAKTRAEVVNDFIESTEWCDVCATYGVKSGAQYHKATKASKNAINFATRLYTCCLKRDAEDGGLKYWSLALTNLEKTGAEAAQFFFESDEFIGFKTSDKEYLMRLYTTFMDRDPAQSEIDYWLGEIAGGRQTRHSILAFFAQSPEFTQICKKYGIDRGTIA